MYRIFIVEDDQVMASTIREQMKVWGNDAVVVSDFKNVVAEFVEYDPHLVLMDVMLPFFNGYHWCTEIRKISNVPVMFLSSASDNMNIVMAMNMGGDDFISKPVDLDVMMAKRKMSLSQLSEKVDITLANLSILKNNKARAVRFSTLEAICKALECQPGDILEFVPDGEEGGSV